MTVLTGEGRDLMPAHGSFDMFAADRLYGDTSLAWRRRVDGWLTCAREVAAIAERGRERIAAVLPFHDGDAA